MNKIIILFLITIILILIYLKLFYYCKSYNIINKNINKFKNINNNIAIVGNGPISDEDRNKINKFKTIYRFNKTPRMKQDDKITHLVIRQDYTNNRIFGLTNFKTQIDVKNIIYIKSHDSLYIENKIKENNPNKNLKVIKTKPVIFNNKEFNFDTDYGASSGLILLSNIYKGQPIHLFGFNLNFPHKGHNSELEKDIIFNKCKNCIIHKTINNDY